MRSSENTEDTDLRSRKCGNNNKLDDGVHGDKSSWSIEAQTTRKTNIELSESTDSNSQVNNKMSTTPSKSVLHRSSLGESSTEDLDIRSANNMWRNEFKPNDEAPIEEREEQVPASKKRFIDIVDVVIRIVIVVVFFKLETTPAFKREIHSEELWLYKNPRRPDIVRGGDLLILVITVPLLLTLIFYAFTKNRRDFRAASWAWTLAVCLNGIPTSLLKITVGRPRPDYFYRCFPDGIMLLNETANTMGSSLLDFNCTGIASEINEGRKSFPSGHSSFAFASFGFVTYYVGAKLHAFDARGRGQTWRLCVAIVPLIVATLVAVSRTCDYHHHWQDVTVGALIGLVCGYYSYRQYYPSIFSTEAGKPFSRWSRIKRREASEELEDTGDGGDVLRRPLLGNSKEQSKWY
ncbi:phospholipid phosphatase 5 isoform X1 [Drosophila sulfurigaster albostrigata]|uniref:phospholipid phosphatase 5 isoform X1 n=2 Tax=Drosophila sulfurigaster albostrigata TaxID=89887 RepID=UPI002D21DEE1|nr:phospholipid phosphatase 5 isoform X1 [Drosophila sulfurigaster albostrigata]